MHTTATQLKAGMFMNGRCMAGGGEYVSVNTYRSNYEPLTYIFNPPPPKKAFADAVERGVGG